MKSNNLIKKGFQIFFALVLGFVLWYLLEIGPGYLMYFSRLATIIISPFTGFLVYPLTLAYAVIFSGFLASKMINGPKKEKIIYGIVTAILGIFVFSCIISTFNLLSGY